MTAKETSTDAEGAPPRADHSSPRRLRSLLRWGIFPLLFGSAVAVSWVCRSFLTTPIDATDASVVHQEDLTKRSPSEDPIALLARGDKALVRHRFLEAIAEYDELVGRGGAVSAVVEYRIALTRELLGRLDLAQASYRKAIDGSVSPSLTFAGHLGLARCLLRRHEPADARRLLYPFLLDETRQHSVPPALAADARFLIALARARELVPKSTARLPQDEFISTSALPLEIPFYLDEIATPVQPRPTARGNGPAAPMVVQKGADRQPAMVVRAECKLPAWEFLEQVAVDGGLKTEWTANAKTSLKERSLQLHLQNWNLSALLECAADSLELSCRIDGATVRFSTVAEMTAAEAPSHPREAARRLLQGLLEGDAVHAWTPAVQLELGNLAAGEGKWREAISWYDRLPREALSSACVIAAYHNIAQVHIRQHALVDARIALLQVIDQSPGHELALRASLRIGQLYLEANEPRAAIVHLKRAQLMAPHSAYHPIATLTLAAAQIQMLEFDKSRKTLADHRTVLHKEPYKAAAALLDTYAQYRLAREVKGAAESRREASELVRTLWRDQDDTLLGPYGQWIIAQACRDLGFVDQAEKLLRKASAETRGPFLPCLEFALAETLVLSNRGAEAKPLFEKLAMHESSWQARSRFELARLDLQHQRYPECAAKCAQLWREKSIADSGALLQLWGSALEGAGEITKAAQCFAGKAPE